MMEQTREAHLSAEQARPQAPARLPRAQCDPRRPAGAGAAPRTGPEAAVGLSRSAADVLPRLKQRADFKHVAGGVRWAAPGLVLQARRDRDPVDGPRVGFTASRKVGGAVQRNRAKRRLRVLADDLIAHCGRSGIAYVLIARRETPEREFGLLRGDLEVALAKVHQRLDRASATGTTP